MPTQLIDLALLGANIIRRRVEKQHGRCSVWPENLCARIFCCCVANPKEHREKKEGTKKKKIHEPKDLSYIFPA